MIKRRDHLTSLASVSSSTHESDIRSFIAKPNMDRESRIPGEKQMKNTLMCTCTAFVFLAAGAFAQANPSTQDTTQPNQGTQSSSPSVSGQETAPGGTMSGDNSASAANMKGEKGEKKMKGCVQSEGGQYMLQTKRGKNVMLTGQDVSAHVGHEVTVHGMWAGAMSGMSNTSAGSAPASGKAFQVTSVDMISETCSMGKGKGGMSGSSGMSGNSTGTSTAPPQ